MTSTPVSGWLKEQSAHGHSARRALIPSCFAPRIGPATCRRAVVVASCCCGAFLSWRLVVVARCCYRGWCLAGPSRRAGRRSHAHGQCRGARPACEAAACTCRRAKDASPQRPDMTHCDFIGGESCTQRIGAPSRGSSCHVAPPRCPTRASEHRIRRDHPENSPRLTQTIRRDGVRIRRGPEAWRRSRARDGAVRASRNPPAPASSVSISANSL